MPASLFAKLTLEVDGEGPKTFAIAARENMDDLRPAFEVITENLRALERRVFDSEGGALGAVWQALAPSTVTARAKGYGYYRGGGKEGPAHRILAWRHVLRDSLTEPNAEGAIASISRSTLIFGTSVPYAKYHAPGGDHKIVPERKFLGLPPDFVRTDVLAPLANYLRGQDPRAGQGQRSTRRVGSLFTQLPNTEAA